MRVQGTLKLLGEGHSTGGLIKRSVVEVGDRQVFNLRVHPRIGSYLEVGEEVALGVCTYAFMKILVALATEDGRVHTSGMVRLVMGALVSTVMVLISLGGILHGASLGWIGLIVFGWLDFGAITGIRTIMTFQPLAPGAARQQGRAEQTVAAGR